MSYEGNGQISKELREILEFLKKNSNGKYLDQYERKFANKLVLIKDLKNDL